MSCPDFYYFYGTPMTSLGEFPTFRDTVNDFKKRFEVGKKYRVDVGCDIYDEDELIKSASYFEGTIKMIELLDKGIWLFMSDGSMLEFIQDDDRNGWWYYEGGNKFDEVIDITEIQ